MLSHRRCSCPGRGDGHAGRSPRIVVTGGPGAGKTAVLEMARRFFCRHVSFVQESASILFGGGFPRRSDEPGRRAAQRAIYRVQIELESLIDVNEDGGDGDSALVLCDRGTIDGLAYWPGPPETFWAELGTRYAVELGRYDAVLHLHTPAASLYDHSNPLRIETPAEAATIDARILTAWSGHPHRYVIDDAEDFMAKALRALAVLQHHLPPCCQTPSERIVAAVG